jgi:hypothetical protein
MLKHSVSVVKKFPLAVGVEAKKFPLVAGVEAKKFPLVAGVRSKFILTQLSQYFN